MQQKTQRLLLVTTTRADWGILSPLARELSLLPSVHLTIAAGNMHLSAQYGYTLNEITADGFNNVIPLTGSEDSNSSRAVIAAEITKGLAEILSEERYDGIIMLGDRFEILAAALAATIADVPIIHLHGGEITEGAMDDYIRNAVSKLAALHLVATEKAGRRLEEMGEERSRIMHTGALGVYNALNVKPMSVEELSATLDGFEVDPDKTFLVTFHPVTRHPEGLDENCQIDILLEALDTVKDANYIITFPNNDPGSEIIIGKLEKFATENKERVKLVRSLGKQRYLSAMHNVRAVLGNTSSGLLEAPSTSAYTIDVGPRQKGREHAPSVIHVADDTREIVNAMTKIMKLERHDPRKITNPYYQEKALELAVNAITEVFPKLSHIKSTH